MISFLSISQTNLKIYFDKGEVFETSFSFARTLRNIFSKNFFPEVNLYFLLCKQCYDCPDTKTLMQQKLNKRLVMKKINSTRIELECKSQIRLVHDPNSVEWNKKLKVASMPVGFNGNVLTIIYGKGTLVKGRDTLNTRTVHKFNANY